MSRSKFVSRIPALAASALLAAVLPAAASDSYSGKVTAVSDGDTLVVSNGGRARVVQLAGIDAPELTQEYGAAARDFVKQMIRGKKVTVEILETKTRQSLVARVAVDGKDVAQALVEAGLAWSSEGATAGLLSAQQKAKSGGQGLWANAKPTPPWEYRKSA